MNRWTGAGKKEQCKRRTRALNVYKNVPSSDLQKKKRKEKVHLSPSQVFLLQFFFFISGMWVCVALESSLVPRGRQTASDGGHGRFFLPGFENPEINLFSFFLPFGKCQADEPEALRLGLTALAASQPGSSYAWRKKEKKKEFPWMFANQNINVPPWQKKYEKKQNKTWPLHCCTVFTTIKKKHYKNKNNKKPDRPLPNLSGEILKKERKKKEKKKKCIASSNVNKMILSS